MKVAVAGKGGTGKTTIAATLARCLARRGNRVLAIDGDSNPNLAMSLGVDPVLADAMRPMPARATIDEQSLMSLIDEYAIAGPDGIRLVLAAKVDQAGGG
ncbi:MAG TPA: AAA family ATPase [Chloroflexota bacterium]|nr:AAA family ATPase [Chloroflexota bacterium]